jgi:hypothetical protein
MKGEQPMSSAEKQLGNDPEGMSAKGWMEDESIGAQQTTTYTLSITNNSVSERTNVKVEVARIAGAGVVVHPPHLTIPVLEPGETENRVFLVHNPTNTVVTNYTLRNRISYAGQVHDFANFTRP